jgi:hypothetical protein
LAENTHLNAAPYTNIACQARAEKSGTRAPAASLRLVGFPALVNESNGAIGIRWKIALSILLEILNPRR